MRDDYSWRLKAKVGAWLVVCACSTLVVGSTVAARPESTNPRRATLAITYSEGSSTSIDMVGSPSRSGIHGRADVSRAKGRTRVRLHMGRLPYPQDLGSFYTTYLLWAVAPEGQATALAELPHSKGFDVDVTTPFQTFGLIVTAEPHSAVSLPSPLIIAENAARKDTVGGFQTGSLEYSGATGTLYRASGSDDRGRRDYDTPLLVLGARRAVDLAQDAGAGEYADGDLRQAELKLETLERARARSRKLPKELEGVAREVMRMGEHARQTAEDRRVQAGLAAERRAASNQVARAESDAQDAREDADQAHARAAAERQRATEAQEQAERARTKEEQARAREQQARVEAEQSQRAAEEARQDKADMQQRLFQSLSAILETRREARGLIVNLSDVLFDFDRATLTPGAREKLSRLAGILQAYPGDYHLDFEGHTDSIGTAQYNLGLSRGRAESVRDYLLGAGIPAERIGSAVGFGKERPVASNASEAGRQLNRRVEIVIADL
jgi:outer membrane protein OmpA-like peptidoglycan-associated protein